MEKLRRGLRYLEKELKGAQHHSLSGNHKFYSQCNTTVQIVERIKLKRIYQVRVRIWSNRNSYTLLMGVLIGTINFVNCMSVSIKTADMQTP